jgi:hypothetical protein
MKVRTFISGKLESRQREGSPESRTGRMRKGISPTQADPSTVSTPNPAGSSRSTSAAGYRPLSAVRSCQPCSISGWGTGRGGREEIGPGDRSSSR